ncbi:MAG: hypothetical protein H6993_04370 [Pseudomonadales bacterium]|nr:hypothetical protein [Pseudomonadales bacterium]MCP5183172.1 hypothetical protein [Pseudomonadales bacterium]
MKAGIQTRLLFTTTLVLGTCLALAGIILDRSFKASVVAGAEQQLRLVTYSLMGVVDYRSGRIALAADLPEPRLNQPESGLYASVLMRDSNRGWKSPSALTSDVPFPEYVLAMDPGEFRFTEDHGAEGPFYYLSYAVSWGAEDGAVLTFTVATETRAFERTVRNFQRNLWLGLSGVLVLFIAAQLLALRWGLRPLRQMAGEVQELEEGGRESLSDDYPPELKVLADNLDRFVEHERRSRTRYRNALDDLAHSLKTPLAVARNALDEANGEASELLREQLSRMESTVHHQLSRASVRGPVVVGASVELGVLIGRLARALRTAYVDRAVALTQEIDPELRVRGDEGDLMEIFGNVLENAFKYSRGQIVVSARRTPGGVAVTVDDDGPGIPEHLREEVLHRGIRADEVQQGQGIGLSVVADLVAAYGASLTIGESPLGGARIEIELR